MTILHRARTVLDNLIKHQINAIELPQYSSDFAHLWLFHLLKIKIITSVKRYESLKAIKERGRSWKRCNHRPIKNAWMSGWSVSMCVSLRMLLFWRSKIECILKLSKNYFIYKFPGLFNHSIFFFFFNFWNKKMCCDTPFMIFFFSI